MFGISIYVLFILIFAFSNKLAKTQYSVQLQFSLFPSLLKDILLADEACLTENSPLQSLNRLLYDELIKSIIKIIDKLDLTVQKQNINEEKVGFTFKKILIYSYSVLFSISLFSRSIIGFLFLFEKFARI